MGQFEENKCVSLTNYETSNISENLISILPTAGRFVKRNGCAEVVLALDSKEGGCVSVGSSSYMTLVVIGWILLSTPRTT